MKLSKAVAQSPVKIATRWDKDVTSIIEGVEYRRCWLYSGKLKHMMHDAIGVDYVPPKKQLDHWRPIDPVIGEDYDDWEPVMDTDMELPQ